MSLLPNPGPTSRAGAEFAAQLQRDFPNLQPGFSAAMQRALGESRMAAGQLSLTRSLGPQDNGLQRQVTQVESAVVLCNDALRLPRFELRPANAAVRLLGSAGLAMLGLGNFGPIAFPNHPEFSQRYDVRSIDDEGTRWLFEDRLLAQLAQRTGLHILGSNGTLILYRSGTGFPGDRMQAFLDEASEVFRAFESAARRPGARNDPNRARPTEYEQFVDKLGASGAGFKVLPAHTLAEAEAFLRQPPPRTITPGIAHYCKKQATHLMLIGGGMMVGAGGFFLLASWDKAPWFVTILLCLVCVAGVGVLIWWLVSPLRARHFLRHGRAGTARIEAIQTRASSVDGDAETWLDLRFEADGGAHRATCLAPAAAVDRLKAIAVEKRTVAVLFSAANPSRVLIVDALVMTRDVA